MKINGCGCLFAWAAIILTVVKLTTPLQISWWLILVVAAPSILYWGINLLLVVLMFIDRWRNPAYYAISDYYEALTGKRFR